MQSRKPYFRVNKTYKMTGAPIKDVTALRGKTVPLVGNVVMTLQSKAIVLPMRIVMGRSVRWSVVPVKSRAT